MFMYVALLASCLWTGGEALPYPPLEAEEQRCVFLPDIAGGFRDTQPQSQTSEIIGTVLVENKTECTQHCCNYAEQGCRAAWFYVDRDGYGNERRLCQLRRCNACASQVFARTDGIESIVMLMEGYQPFNSDQQPAPSPSSSYAYPQSSASAAVENPQSAVWPQQSPAETPSLYPDNNQILGQQPAGQIDPYGQINPLPSSQTAYGEPNPIQGSQSDYGQVNPIQGSPDEYVQPNPIQGSQIDYGQGSQGEYAQPSPIQGSQSQYFPVLPQQPMEDGVPQQQPQQPQGQWVQIPGTNEYTWQVPDNAPAQAPYDGVIAPELPINEVPPVVEGVPVGYPGVLGVSNDTDALDDTLPLGENVTVAPEYGLNETEATTASSETTTKQANKNSIWNLWGAWGNDDDDDDDDDFEDEDDEWTEEDEEEWEKEEEEWEKEEEEWEEEWEKEEEELEEELAAERNNTMLESTTLSSTETVPEIVENDWDNPTVIQNQEDWDKPVSTENQDQLAESLEQEEPEQVGDNYIYRPGTNGLPIEDEYNDSYINVPLIAIGACAAVVLILLVFVVLGRRITSNNDRGQYKPLRESFLGSSTYHEEI